MSKNERPLPKPPKTPFGAARSSSEQGPDGLLSDRMAEAAIQGKLDEFLRAELPDSEQARSLARMMMGMSGMMLAGAGPVPDQPPAAAQQGEVQPFSQQEVPAEVVKMVQGGDVKGLMDILRQEHLKRSPEASLTSTAETGSAPEAAPSQPAGMPTIDKDLIDSMIRIAKDNSVSLDWIILRAIKVYVEEFKKTGKL
jgi:hypothetical protein